MMSSPVHKILFSPPSSPPSYAATHDETETLSTLRDLLLPVARSPVPVYLNSPKISSPLAAVPHPESAPGGFSSTSGYPSRYPAGLDRSSFSKFQAGPERPRSVTPNPFEASAKLFLERSSAASNSGSKDRLQSPGLHRRSSSNVSALPVYTVSQYGLHRTCTIGTGPRRSVRLVLLTLVGILAGLWILTHGQLPRFSNPSASLAGADDGTLSPAAMREHLISIQSAGRQDSRTGSRSASYTVGGKRVVVRPGGAPSRIYAQGRPGVVSAHPKASRPVKTTPITSERELLALQTFLLEDTLHTVSPSVDTSLPLDPTFMLSFDPKDENGWRELRRDVDPVVVWDVGHAWTAPVYDMLALYSILPAPRVLLLEDREDADRIHSILSRLVHRRVADSAQPLITIGGTPIDGYEELVRYHKEGLLYDMLERAGAVVDGQKEAERIEMARRSRARPMKYGKVERDR